MKGAQTVMLAGQYKITQFSYTTNWTLSARCTNLIQLGFSRLTCIIWKPNTWTYLDLISVSLQPVSTKPKKYT